MGEQNWVNTCRDEGFSRRGISSEYLSYKEEVGGSNPSSPTDNKPSFYDGGFVFGVGYFSVIQIIIKLERGHKSGGHVSTPSKA